MPKPVKPPKTNATAHIGKKSLKKPPGAVIASVGKKTAKRLPGSAVGNLGKKSNKPKGKSKVVKFEDGSSGSFLGKPTKAQLEAQKLRKSKK